MSSFGANCTRERSQCVHRGGTEASVTKAKIFIDISMYICDSVFAAGAGAVALQALSGLNGAGDGAGAAILVKMVPNGSRMVP